MSCQDMSCHAGAVSPSSQSIDDYEQRFNCNASVGVAGGVCTRGSSLNHGILHEQLDVLLSDYEAQRRPKPTRSFKQRNSCLVSVLRLPFGPAGVVGTAILNGPWDDVKEYIEHCSAPTFRVVEAYNDAIVHLVIEMAKLLRAGREPPAILHKDISTAFSRYGIHLRLHQRHRLEGDEIMPQDELANVSRGRLAGGGVGTVRERLGSKSTTILAFMEAFESTQGAPSPSSPAGHSGVARQSFGEEGLWRHRTSSAVFTSTSTRTTSEEHLVGSTFASEVGTFSLAEQPEGHALQRAGALSCTCHHPSVGDNGLRRVAVYSTPFVPCSSRSAGRDCLR